MRILGWRKGMTIVIFCKFGCALVQAVSFPVLTDASCNRCSQLAQLKLLLWHVLPE